MDLALPNPGIPNVRLDRRRLVALVLAGAAGAAFTEAGFPVMRRPYADDPAMMLDSVNRTLTALAAGYDSLDLRKTDVALRAAERWLSTVFTGGMLPAQIKDAKAVYARLMTMSASVAVGLGDFREAVRTGELAASLATEVGDPQTGGHAWSVVAAGLAKIGKGRQSLDIARRARITAGSSPAGVMSLLEEAVTASSLGQAYTVVDSIAAAEEAHSRLADQAWGSPGYPLGGYHPANLKLFAGYALTRVGMHGEAVPRLDEAAALLSGTSADGLRTFAWLGQAGAALGSGDVDMAHDYAATAVAKAESRPEAGVVRAVRRMHRASRGAFGDLVERTAQWRLAAT